MKKLYTTLALATMMVGTISAAAPRVADAQKVYEAPATAKTLVANADFSQQSLEKGIQTRAISSVEDLVGVYKINPDWWWPFQGDAGDDPSFYISHLDGDMIEISCSQMGMCTPILATVDLAKGTITIKTDDNKNLCADPQIDLYIKGIDFDHDGKLFDTTSYTANIIETGQIDFMSAVLLWGNSQGFYYGCGNFYLTPMEMWSYNPSEWEEFKDGKAQFTDGFVNPLLVGSKDQPVGATDVDLYYNKTNPCLLMLKNPYGAEVWQEVLGGTEDGYMVLDISNKDCVTMTPLVGSGVIINFGNQSEPDIQELFFFNNEGYRLMNGRTTQSQVEEVEEAMDPFDETLADYLSSYDAATGTIRIRNGFFGQTTDPLAKYFWNGVDKTTYLTATVVLPAAFVSGVNDVEVEDVNAPVKYYNLQGMEVAAPEAGQLVIMKKGTKASKFIAK